MSTSGRADLAAGDDRSSRPSATTRVAGASRSASVRRGLRHARQRRPSTGTDAVVSGAPPRRQACGQRIESRAMSTDETSPAPTHDGDAPGAPAWPSSSGAGRPSTPCRAPRPPSVLRGARPRPLRRRAVGIAKDGHWVLAADDPEAAASWPPGHVPEVDTDAASVIVPTERHRPHPRRARGRPAAAHARRGRRRLPAAARPVRRGRHDPGPARPRRRALRRVRRHWPPRR